MQYAQFCIEPFFKVGLCSVRLHLNQAYYKRRAKSENAGKACHSNGGVHPVQQARAYIDVAMTAMMRWWHDS